MVRDTRYGRLSAKYPDNRLRAAGGVKLLTKVKKNATIVQ